MKYLKFGMWLLVALVVFLGLLSAYISFIPPSFKNCTTSGCIDERICLIVYAGKSSSEVPAICQSYMDYK